MSPDGILTIMAPKMMLEGKSCVVVHITLKYRNGATFGVVIAGSNERVIPITMTRTAGSTNPSTPISQRT